MTAPKTNHPTRVNLRRTAGNRIASTAMISSVLKSMGRIDASGMPPPQALYIGFQALARCGSGRLVGLAPRPAAMGDREGAGDLRTEQEDLR